MIYCLLLYSSYFIPPGPLSGRTAPLHSWFRPIRIHVHEVDLAHHLPDVSSQDLYRELISDGLDLIRQLLQGQLFNVFPLISVLKFPIYICRLLIEYTIQIVSIIRLTLTVHHLHIIVIVNIVLTCCGDGNSTLCFFNSTEAVFAQEFFLHYFVF